MMTIGVISDTHGLMRPEALARLAGVERILHASDIGSPEVLDALAAIAPVTAIRGNNDRAAWARRGASSCRSRPHGCRSRITRSPPRSWIARLQKGRES